MKQAAMKTLNIMILVFLIVGFGSVSMAGHRPGHSGGKPPGPGNQVEEGTADFIFNLRGSIAGNFNDDVDDSGFEILEGQLAGESESITVSGDAGIELIIVDEACTGALPLLACSEFASGLGILPSGAVTFNGTVEFPAATGVTWTIRLDHDKTPSNRVQFKMSWNNRNGEQHFLRAGWVIQGENSPVGIDFGEMIMETTTLRIGEIEFNADPFQIDGRLLTGRGKKTEGVTYSPYGQNGTITFEISTLVPLVP